MSDRASIRGGRGGSRGDRGGRGGRGGGGAGGATSERPKKENILNLEKYMDKQITVKFNGGREGMFDPHLAVLFCLLPCRSSPPPSPWCYFSRLATLAEWSYCSTSTCAANN